MTWRDYLSPLSCPIKCPHSEISTCDKSVVWSSSCLKKPHFHAFYDKLKQKDPYCAYPFEEMLHISLIAYIHTHKKQAHTHTSNEDRNLAVSLLSSVSVWLPTAARRSLKFCLLSCLWIGQHQGLQHTSTKLFLSLCAALETFAASKYKLLICTFYLHPQFLALWWSCILGSVMS